MWYISNRNLPAACGFALGVAFLTACDSKEASPRASAAQPVEQSTERGPVQITVRSDRGEISVGENLQITIEAFVETGVALQAPKFEKQIGAFEIVESHTPPDIPDGANRRWTHRYTLRTFEAGEQQIPSIVAKFTDSRNAAADATASESEISTPPLTIQVRSLLAADVNPEQFRDIKNEVAVPLPWNYRPWLYGTGAALLAVGMITSTVLFARRRGERTALAASPPLPHIWALQQLDQLASEHLIERSEYHEFYFRLSAIVRQYIERRFGIMAAEQTTDEFLREAQRDPSLTEQHRLLLRDFLRQADLVKFARFQPQQHESEGALAAARRFVHETTPIAATSSPPELVEASA